MTTGQKLRKARKQALLTQVELAELSGVAASTINRSECGKGEPHPHTLRLLARALGVPPKELLADEDHEEPLARDAATYVTRSLSPDS
jgi:transcriptional regulator with XRE-family HTH domain